MALISKKTLAGEVAERLSTQIASGDYNVGDKLPIEPELMKTFGVGRSSVREAVKILTMQGLLHVQQGVGTFVATTRAQESLKTHMSRAELIDVLEVRSLLEVKIAEKAAVHRNDKQLLAMKKWLAHREKYALENDIKNCISSDVNFHISISEACGNSLLTEIYKAASVEITKSIENNCKDTSAFASSQSLHADLLKAIELQDVEKAGQVVKAIINKI